MRIGIDAFPVIRTYGGIGCYTRNLLKALLEVGGKEEFFAYVPSKSSKDRQKLGWDASPQIHWMEVKKPFFKWCGWVDGLDLYHGTNFKLQTKGRYGTVLTLHDFWLDRHPEYSKKFLGQRPSFFRTRRRARKATRVIAVSRHTAQDIQELYGLPADRISVIHSGVSPEFFPEKDSAKFDKLRTQYHIPPHPYILFVGGAEPRKNHRVLLQAFSRNINTHLLIVVGNPTHRVGSVLHTSRDLGITDRVLCTGPVSVEDLRLLYSHADLFVFPSRYEGFGFPVLEAMACGAPVITSNTTAIPEVAGEAAILVNPENVEELADAIHRVIQSSDLMADLRTRGFQRVKQFTWEKAALKTMKVYRELVP